MFIIPKEAREAIKNYHKVVSKIIRKDRRLTLYEISLYLECEEKLVMKIQTHIIRIRFVKRVSRKIDSLLDGVFQCAWDRLTQEERNVLSLRFGIENGIEYTPKETEAKITNAR